MTKIKIIANSIIDVAHENFDKVLEVTDIASIGTFSHLAGEAKDDAEIELFNAIMEHRDLNDAEFTEDPDDINEEEDKEISDDANTLGGENNP